MKLFVSLPTLIGFAISLFAAAIAYVITYKRHSHRYFDKRHARELAIEVFILMLAILMGLSVGIGLLAQ